MSHTTEVELEVREESILKQAEKLLKKEGVNCNLKKNAIPRMYYRDQLQRHLGRDSEVCPYVLELPDASYDLAFVESETVDGKKCLKPYFDDWNGTSVTPVSAVLGNTFDGTREHWSGKKKADVQQQHSIGKFLQSYAEALAVDDLTKKGFRVASRKRNKKGEISMELVKL